MKRRELLRRGAAVTTALGVAGIAGCAQTAGLMSSRPEYFRWAYAPGELGGDGDPYLTKIRTPATILDNEEHFSDEYVSQLNPGLGITADTGVEQESVQRYINPGIVEIYQAEFSQADVADMLESNGYSQEDEFEGYTIYVDSEAFRSWAVSSDELVLGGSLEIAADAVIRDAIEVRTGEKERYVETSETMDLLTKRVSEGYQTFIYPYPEYAKNELEANGIAVSAQLDGETTTVEFVFVIEEGADVDVDKYRNEVARQGDDRYSDPDELTANSTDRTITISNEIETRNAVYWRSDNDDEIDFWVGAGSESV